jgi:hypothetical protein
VLAPVANLLACAPTTTRGRAVHLNADPQGNKFVYASGKKIIIRDFAVRQRRC